MEKQKYPYVNSEYQSDSITRRRLASARHSLMSRTIGRAIPRSMWPTALRAWKGMKAITKMESSTTKELRAIRSILHEIQYRLNNDAYMRHQDIMGLLSTLAPILSKTQLAVETEFPVAYDSNDHIYPEGTINDNTRHPRFSRACETYFQRKLSFLDLGCAGGGLVLDFLLNGHLAVGIEGSDISQKAQRAEWRLISDSLFTADITKPFKVLERDSVRIQRFDVISAWEMLEHIHEDDLPQLFKNVSDHLADGGLFVGSIGTRPSHNHTTGHELHMSVQRPEWWMEKMRIYGFEPMENQPFEYEDFTRGTGNGLNDPDFRINPIGFHFVVQNRPVPPIVYRRTEEISESTEHDRCDSNSRERLSQS